MANTRKKHGRVQGENGAGCCPAGWRGSRIVEPVRSACQPDPGREKTLLDGSARCSRGGMPPVETTRRRGGTSARNCKTHGRCRLQVDVT
jgi:hypothetical protein